MMLCLPVNMNDLQVFPDYFPCLVSRVMQLQKCHIASTACTALSALSCFISVDKLHLGSMCCRRILEHSNRLHLCMDCNRLHIAFVHGL